MYTQKHILYMDDPQNQLSFNALFRRKFPIFTVERSAEAKVLMNQYPIKIFLSNQQSAVQPALELLQWTKDHHSDIIRILVYSHDYNLPLTNTHKNHDGIVHQYLWKPWSTADMESVLLKWWGA